MSISPFNEEYLKERSFLKENLKNQISLTTNTQIIDSIFSKNYTNLRNSQNYNEKFSAVDLLIMSKESQKANIYHRFKEKEGSSSYQNKLKSMKEKTKRKERKRKGTNSIRKQKFAKKKEREKERKS